MFGRIIRFGPAVVFLGGLVITATVAGAVKRVVVEGLSG